MSSAMTRLCCLMAARARPPTERASRLAQNGRTRKDAIMASAMRPHLAFATNTALQPAPDVLRVLVVSSSPLMRARLMTILGAYRDLDLTESGAADVILCDEMMADADLPALILVRDAAAAATALANG